jgi:serine/threonine protein kinase
MQIVQLLRAMEYLHSCALFHGNLKPSNVLVDARHVLRVCDFGFGKLCTLPHGYLGDVVLENNKPHPIVWKPTGKSIYLKPLLMNTEYYTPYVAYSWSSDIHTCGSLITYMYTYGKYHPFIGRIQQNAISARVSFEH